MLDTKTITQTLAALALLGCSGGKQTEPVSGDTPPGDTVPADTVPAVDTAAPTAEAPATSAPSAVSSAEVAPAPAALPGGRTEPLPPKDGKKVADKKDSKRTGAMACCGEGTCGECKPLPAARTEPKAPKDGEVMPASQSKRKGKEACCGEGTCGPC
jgi:hypothetical protein